ncbi:MAG: leucine/isoleucine/valine-binding protein precursor, partial [Candidatus Desulfofervidaceae bacterium]|nr:leucine/isoleucine/valine-binding protein precursor [Candidatus Desulfofervidaceae bacterium]
MKNCFFLIFVSLMVLFNSFWGRAEEKIILGCSAAMSGHAGFLGQNLVMGMESYFKYVNSQGG